MYEELIKNLRHDSVSALQNCEFDFVHDWMLKAADAIEELSKLHETQKRNLSVLTDELMRRWIPVTERLPNVGEIVIVYTTKATISRRRVFLDVMITSTNTDIPFWAANNGRVTHWMPLPDPPKEE